MKKEFTATVYLIDNQKVLLHYHQKLDKWLPPGGHMEKDESPAETARREVLEETGLEIDFYLQENISIHEANAISIERPYLCLLENIPPIGDIPAHQHIDFVYVGKPLDNQTPFSNCRWFNQEALSLLKPNIEIFQETLDVIDHLFEAVGSLCLK